MGRRNKAYSKDLHQQAYDRLTGMQAFGESKKEAVANGTEKEKIFSFNTYKSYWKHTKYFIKYIKENHPECTTLKSAKKYVNEWLQAGWTRAFLHGRSSWRPRPWESCTVFLRMMKTTSSPQNGTGRTSNGAAGTG
mgnify:CR=1 FL=1